MNKLPKIYSYTIGFTGIICLLFAMYILIAEPFPQTNATAFAAMIIAGCLCAFVFVLTQKNIDAREAEINAAKKKLQDIEDSAKLMERLKAKWQSQNIN